jgi:hypothetical protein
VFATFQTLLFNSTTPSTLTWVLSSKHSAIEYWLMPPPLSGKNICPL